MAMFDISATMAAGLWSLIWQRFVSRIALLEAFDFEI